MVGLYLFGAQEGLGQVLAFSNFFEFLRRVNEIILSGLWQARRTYQKVQTFFFIGKKKHGYQLSC